MIADLLQRHDRYRAIQALPGTGQVLAVAILAGPGCVTCSLRCPLERAFDYSTRNALILVSGYRTSDAICEAGPEGLTRFLRHVRAVRNRGWCRRKRSERLTKPCSPSPAASSTSCGPCYATAVSSPPDPRAALVA